MTVLPTGSSPYPHPWAPQASLLCHSNPQPCPQPAHSRPLPRLVPTLIQSTNHLPAAEDPEAVPLVLSDDPELAEPELLPPAEPASEPAAGLDAFFLVSRGGSSPLLPSPTGTSSALRVVFGASAPFGK